MKMTVQWRRNLGTYRAGESIELPADTARALIAAGLAKEPDPPPEEHEPPKRRYRRRDLTAEGSAAAESE